MKPIDEFEITMGSFRGAGSFRFHVAVIYSSDVVDRFRLTGGDKIMEMEKRLLVKRHPWKVTAINFEFKVMDDDTIKILHHIWNLIDEKRYGKSGRSKGY